MPQNEAIIFKFIVTDVGPYALSRVECLAPQSEQCQWGRPRSVLSFWFNLAPLQLVDLALYRE